MRNYWLGGTDNFEVDREVAGRVQAAMPSILNLSDNPLELLLEDEVRPGDILPVGLLVLSALAQLCHSDSVSVLERTTSPGT
jgi:hypothetical protein